VPREAADVKALRYLSSARLIVTKVDGRTIEPLCRGDSGVVYSLGWDVPSRWWCSCPSSARRVQSHDRAPACPAGAGIGRAVLRPSVDAPACASMQDAFAEGLPTSLQTRHRLFSGGPPSTISGERRSSMLPSRDAATSEPCSWSRSNVLACGRRNRDGRVTGM
jgi:hypothetical protein